MDLMRAVAAASLVALAGVAACGSKTGLFADEAAIAFDAGTPPKIACVPGEFTLSRAAAQVIFAIDRSGSMAFALDGSDATPANPSRWSLVRDALGATLPGVESRIEMGAKFFPEPIDPSLRSFTPTEGCLLDPAALIAPAKNSAGALLGVFDTTEPKGGTPTALAIVAATAYLTAPERRSVARFIVLATDGAPNCNADPPTPAARCVCTAPSPGDCAADSLGVYSCLDDARTLDAIRNASSRGVPVYVVGLGSDSRPELIDVLNQMAIAGGRPRATDPRYFDVRTPSDLASALAQIQAGILACAFVTPSRPDDPNAIEVDGVKVPRDTAHVNGWDWVDRDFGEMALFGAACRRVTSDSTRVSGIVACGR